MLGQGIVESDRMNSGRRRFIRDFVVGGLALPTMPLWLRGDESWKLQPRRVPASFFSPRPDTLVTWLGMAGVLINTRGTVLLIDPLITLIESEGEPKCEGHYRLRVPLPIEIGQIPRVDAVLYTHADGDHFGRLTAQRLAAREETKFVATPPVRTLLEELGVSEERQIEAKDFASIRIGSAIVEVTPALHDWQDEDPWERGDCCGYVVRTQDGSVWHPGDTRLIDELLLVQNVDVLFFDVAAVRSHLGPKGSARIAVTSGAELMVAYHYGTFELPPGSYGNCDPRDALPFVEGLSARYLQLSPGELLRLPLRRGESAR